ncbi:hypothetical protein AMS68_000616 [Peltaster fructicola]|uniref:Protein kinase domain-containing protein n=1 Tax=Peltaster fructicola TaxID=286661 RepID=A0A6H0XKD9_9PEZI|nr:hypothetical protein AMS68_000616 [Peltaster fructicola]
MSSKWADSAADLAEDAKRKAQKEEKKRLKAQKKAEEEAQHLTRSEQEDRPAKRRRLSLDRIAPSDNEPHRRLAAPSWQSCRSITRYQQLNPIEEGSYGFVSRAREEATGQIVAIKKLKIEPLRDGGFPVTALREIQCLGIARHRHVVELREVVVGEGEARGDVYLIMDFLEHDLKSLQEDMQDPFTASEVKTLMLQLGSAVEFLHDHWILHRDLKTSNILMNNQGEIKLADFGMARLCGDPQPPNLTQLVVTLWYRSPELLLGATSYGQPVDMWSIGCVFGELLAKTAILQGKNEVEQLSKIIDLRGPPTNEAWPEFKRLPNAKHLRLSQSVQNGGVRTKFQSLSSAGVELLESLLAWNPDDRPTARNMLGHRYFVEHPRPKPTAMFPTFPSKAETAGRETYLGPDSAPSLLHGVQNDRERLLIDCAQTSLHDKTVHLGDHHAPSTDTPTLSPLHPGDVNHGREAWTDNATRLEHDSQSLKSVRNEDDASRPEPLHEVLSDAEEPSGASGPSKTSNSVKTHGATESSSPKSILISASTMLLMRRGLIAANDAGLLTTQKRLLAASDMPERARKSLAHGKSTKVLQSQSRQLKRTSDAMQQRTSTTAMQRHRQSLPILAAKAELVSIVNDNPYIVVIGATGCGKSTQVPQMILDSAIDAVQGASCNILCTQPRRIAALALAKRVAEERQEILGDSVGYHVRHDKVGSRDYGSITYLTTGVLLKQLRSNPDIVFDNVSHIILDEVHERDVSMDLLMLSLKRLIAARQQASRPIPKIVLMSATLDVNLIANYWTPGGRSCPTLTIPGKLFPVSKQYLDHILDDTGPSIGSILDNLRPRFPAEVATAEAYIQDEVRLAEASIEHKEATTTPAIDVTPHVSILLVVAAVIKVCTTTSAGAVLVFLPGLQEIQQLQNLLSSLTLADHNLDCVSLEVLQLHSTLPKTEQSLIFNPLTDRRRRIILSTNIAETSITVPHITHVIDSGVSRAPRYDPTSKATTLEYVWESQSSSEQRMGRAGRVQAGHYMALFSEARFALMPLTSVPEIMRTNLVALALDVKARFPSERLETLLGEALQAPTVESINAARNELQAIHAIDQDEELTILGRLLSQLPLPPHWGRVVLMGVLFNCLDPILIIATSIGSDLFYRPIGREAEALQRHQQFNTTRSDHLAFYHAYAALRKVELSGGIAAARRFAQENFLSWLVYLNIKKDILATERDMQKYSIITKTSATRKGTQTHPSMGQHDLLPTNLFGGQLYNSNSDNHELIKCLILSGYPSNLAAYHKGSRWTTGSRFGFVQSSSFSVKKPSSEERSQLVLRLFTALRESSTSEHLSMGQVSALTALAGLLFCDRLSVRSGTLRINELPHAQFEDCPDDAAKLVLEYKKLSDRVICNALQEIAASRKGVQVRPETRSFVRQLVDVLTSVSSVDLPTSSQTFEASQDAKL